MKYIKIFLSFCIVVFIGCSCKENKINSYPNKQETLKEAEKNFKELDKETR